MTGKLNSFILKCNYAKHRNTLEKVFEIFKYSFLFTNNFFQSFRSYIYSYLQNKNLYFFYLQTKNVIHCKL